jgi:hypothetical protein
MDDGQWARAIKPQTLHASKKTGNITYHVMKSVGDGPCYIWFVDKQPHKDPAEGHECNIYAP